jgi:hypothetical protein
MYCLPPHGFADAYDCHLEYRDDTSITKFKCNTDKTIDEYYTLNAGCDGSVLDFSIHSKEEDTRMGLIIFTIILAIIAVISFLIWLSTRY